MKKTAMEKESDENKRMENTMPEEKAHPPPAAATAGNSKVEEGKEGMNNGGGKKVFSLKERFENKAQKEKEEAEQSAGEGTSGKRLPAGGENQERGSGGGEADGGKK
ncbi:hypothetical protein KUCAC02_017009 [Chaenocephalus aceratus]|nr:hypothetical protein KUCAC02_017009 [Chaenocephalus aceratus]